MPHCDAPGCVITDKPHRIVIWTDPTGDTHSYEYGCLIWQISATAHVLNELTGTYLESAKRKGIPELFAKIALRELLNNAAAIPNKASKDIPPDVRMRRIDIE